MLDRLLRWLFLHMVDYAVEVVYRFADLRVHWWPQELVKIRHDSIVSRLTPLGMRASEHSAMQWRYCQKLCRCTWAASERPNEPTKLDFAPTDRITDIRSVGLHERDWFNQIPQTLVVWLGEHVYN